ncbi:16S rRNA (adenine(1518)-N(6)/adenine(1519)-N(6))-dimethyltransferase RsmA [Thermoproteota archaeon]
MIKKPRLGQVFLNDKNIVQKIVKSAQITPEDTVVEIGCGQGVLSQALAPLCKKLIIIELDQQYLDYTRTLLSEYDNITYIKGDILKVGFKDIDEKQFKVVANIPYYITSKIIKLMIEKGRDLQPSLLMVQKEFAEKLLAQPGAKTYTSFTLYTRFYMEIKKMFHVKQSCFKPIPDVDSTVIQLTSRNTPLYDVDAELFFPMIRSAFWGRRKPLLNALLKSPYLQLDPRIRECEFFKKHSSIRGETLGIEDFYCLYLEIVKKHFVQK